MHRRHSGHVSHRFRKRDRILAVPAHAHLERAQAAQGQPRVERTERAAHAHRARSRCGDRLRVAGHDPREQVRMPADVLGGAVHHHVCTQFDGTAEDGRREGVVDEHRHSSLSGHPRDGLHVGHPAQRVGDGLEKHEPGAVQRGPDCVEVQDVHEHWLVSGRLEVLAEQRHRSAVQLARRHDRRGTRRERQDRHVQGCHARRGRDRGLRALEVGDSGLEHRAVLVGVAAIEIALALTACDGFVVVEILVDVHRGGSDRRRQRGAGLDLAAGMHRPRSRLHGRVDACA